MCKDLWNSVYLALVGNRPPLSIRGYQHGIQGERQTLRHQGSSRRAGPRAMEQHGCRRSDLDVHHVQAARPCRLQKVSKKK